MHIRKIVATACALALVVSLAGCNNSEKNSKENSNGSSANATNQSTKETVVEDSKVDDIDFTSFVTFEKGELSEEDKNDTLSILYGSSRYRQGKNRAIEHYVTDDLNISCQTMTDVFYDDAGERGYIINQRWGGGEGLFYKDNLTDTYVARYEGNEDGLYISCFYIPFFKKYQYGSTLGLVGTAQQNWRLKNRDVISFGDHTEYLDIAFLEVIDENINNNGDYYQEFINIDYKTGEMTKISREYKEGVFSEWKKESGKADVEYYKGLVKALKTPPSYDEQQKTEGLYREKLPWMVVVPDFNNNVFDDYFLLNYKSIVDRKSKVDVLTTYFEYLDNETELWSDYYELALNIGAGLQTYAGRRIECLSFLMDPSDERLQSYSIENILK